MLRQFFQMLLGEPIYPALPAEAQDEPTSVEEDSPPSTKVLRNPHLDSMIFQQEQNKFEVRNVFTLTLQEIEQLYSDIEKNDEGAGARLLAPFSERIQQDLKSKKALEMQQQQRTQGPIRRVQSDPIHVHDDEKTLPGQTNRAGNVTQSLVDLEETDFWFSDNIIDSYFSYLAQRYPDKKIETISSLYDLQKLKIKMAESRDNKWEKKLKNADIIFWPIHHANNHWMLLVIERREWGYTVKCLDGLNLTQSHKKYLDIGEALIRMLHGDAFEVKSDSLRILQQSNIRDCGAAICYFANKICEGISLEDYMKYEGKCNFNEFRLNVGLSIVGILQPTLSPMYQRFRQTVGNVDKGSQSMGPSIPRTMSSPPTL